MMRFLRTAYLLFGLMVLHVSGYAQKVEFNVDVPSIVTVGERFNLEFSVNAKPDGFSMPELDGFNVLAGPIESRGQSVSIVGNNVQTEVKFSYIYTLQAPTAGKFTIPAATVTVDGKSYTSQSVPIEVVADASSGGGGGGRAQRQDKEPQTTIAPDDVLMRVIVSRNNVFKGQPIRVSFKLYYRVPLSTYEPYKLPAFNGFWSQKLNTANYKAQREVYKSKVYETQVLEEYLLYPQQAGVLYIEQFDITVVAQIVMQARRQSEWDMLFGGGPEIHEVRKRVTAPPVKITVKELPSGAPSSFAGAVGDFTMSAKLPTTTIAANSAATYTVKISGTGNLPLIQAPKLSLPTSFEQYNMKTTESLNSGGNGITGYRQFEYPFIARAEGEYTVPPVEFSYFNPDAGKYVTLSSKEQNILVQPDSTSGSGSSGGTMISGLNKEDIKILGQDIRFIKIGSAGLSAQGSVLMGNWLYYVIVLLLIAGFVFLLIYLQKRIREQRNAVLVRGKRANKVALQRLRAAEGYMKADNQRQFYEEMLRALWGYMSDKLNIPVANLTKENMREELLKRDVATETTGKYIDIISDCEYAQYSPAGSGQMHEVYRQAVETISKLESVIKR